ncbi:sensor domain-containing diguanylate cyclase [Shewanella avicenniae]|uniref:Sensor domain-containing diguanylate cyclase n=1 Tax=Shewanella avicenniae TaxID=2814294 RepID=A0ABX7QPK4_9GAMM|nr:diguanylate cyclase [Shewanella avicenniae]QSX32947.1 sensor domain-containing diguanylate cyclase [Shewanella avicenniae]
MKQKSLLWLLSALYVMLAIVTTEFVTRSFAQQQLFAEQDLVKNRLSLIRSHLESAIFMDTYLADSLATVVTIDPNFAIDNWNAIGAKLLSKAHFVRNVGIAPNNIISHIFPIEGNEKAIGFDFRSRPEQFRTVELAKKLQGVYIAGPLELVQGGEAIIARFPIFADYPKNTRYWGSVSVVMDFQRLIEASGLTALSGAHASLKKRDISNPQGRIFYGDPAIFDVPDIEMGITLPNGEWLLAAQYDIHNADHVQMTKLSIRSMGVIVAVLGYIIIMLLYRNYLVVHTASLQDELTSLPNRRSMMLLLKRLLDRPSGQYTFAILNIDLNGFKHVNDELGHEAGDELLKHVARQLSNAVRNDDMVARIGGDEFIVVLQNVRKDTHIGEIAEKIKQITEAHSLSWGESQISPSLSVGYAVYDGSQKSIKDLLKQADNHMYHVKTRFKHALDYTI